MNRIPILIQGSGGVGGSGSGGGSQTQDGAAKYSIGYDPDTNELIFEKDDVEDSRINITPTGGGSGGGGVTADAKLAAAMTTTKEVGGVVAGKTFPVGTSHESILREILSPTLNPTVKAPSATIKANGTTLFESGSSNSVGIIVTFDRGKIDPAYGTSGYRSGEATGYSLNGGAAQASGNFNVTVTESNKSFTGTVSYGAGEQPKDSNGGDYESPLEAGSVNTPALNFEFVDAIWSNAADITTIAKEALVSKSAKQKAFNFPAQTVANPEVFDVPASWNVTAVEVLNTLSNQWQDSSADFTVTDETHGSVQYKRYTYNVGIATGPRSIRIKWS